MHAIHHARTHARTHARLSQPIICNIIVLYLRLNYVCIVKKCCCCSPISERHQRCDNTEPLFAWRIVYIRCDKKKLKFATLYINRQYI